MLDRHLQSKQCYKSYGEPDTVNSETLLIELQLRTGIPQCILQCYSGTPHLSQQDITVLDVNDMNASMREQVAQTVVLVLIMVKQLGSQNAEFMLEYSQVRKYKDFNTTTV